MSAVLIVVGIVLLVEEQIDEAADAEILSYYAESGNRTKEFVGFFLVTVGVMLFLWFLSTLRSQLASAETESKPLSTLGFGAGVTAAASYLGGAALIAGTSLATELSDEFQVDPDLARFAVVTGFLFLIGAVLVNCVLVITTSVLALRTAALPNWLGWVGLVAVVLAVVEAFLLPVFVIPLWILVVSVVLTWGTTPADRPQVQTPEAT